MGILKITNTNFDEEVLNTDKTVIIDFYADWCGPCKIMAKTMEEIATEVKEDVKIGKINIDENQDLAVKYGVMSIPTIIIFEKGQEKATYVGVQNKETILNSI